MTKFFQNQCEKVFDIFPLENEELEVITVNVSLKKRVGNPLYWKPWVPLYSLQ